MEKIFANNETNKVSISKTHKQFIQFNNNNNKTTQLKNKQKD